MSGHTAASTNDHFAAISCDHNDPPCPATFLARTTQKARELAADRGWLRTKTTPPRDFCPAHNPERTPAP